MLIHLHSHAGNAYKVLYRDGSEEVVDNCCMAPDYQPGTVVMYSPPQGGGSITGSILNADGSFWCAPYWRSKQSLSLAAP